MVAVQVLKVGQVSVNPQKISAGSDVGNKLQASERLYSPSDSESALTDAADGGLGGRGFGVGGDIRFLPTNSTYVPGKSPFSCRTQIKDRRCENHIKSVTIIFWRLVWVTQQKRYERSR